VTAIQAIGVFVIGLLLGFVFGMGYAYEQAAKIISRGGRK
jgi:hypothetical protein